ncbi:hypothetical protein BB561_003101 [Smittium simulii]|uniref:A20-type domain-containing protein n=1 Tax=Smittium simulii TaxID=133385 RepID=A0A2T9YMU1_9FUNG|nr:hypothetical protein BB561_003101 [Smittium simulii]
MEKNSDSQVPPEFCTNSCGFYGNPIYENMCSKCFKAKEEQANKKDLDTAPPQSSNTIPVMQQLEAIESSPTQQASALDSLQTPKPQIIEPVQQIITSPTQLSITKKAQTNKGRCLVCRIKIPLVKQTTNKCRCEKVFCDVHKFPDQHSCEFDFIQRDRKELEKNNPKINEHPRGGRSFNRIE